MATNDVCTGCMPALTTLMYLCFIAALSGTAAAADAERVKVFSQAQFLPSDARKPPGDDADWISVSLPDEWRRRSRSIEAGWYRIKFDLSDKPERLYGIFVRYRRAQSVALYANGTRIGGSRESNAEAAGRVGAGREATINLSVPPSVLRAGANVLHVRMEATSHPAQIHGLGRVYFGDARTVRKTYVEFAEWGFNAKRDAIVLSLATGIMMTFIWLARRRDRVIFWFSIACLSWGAIGYLYLKIRWSVPVSAASALYFYVTYGLVVPTLIIALRTVDLRWPRIELGLWAFFLIEMSYPFWPGTGWPGATFAWDTVNASLLAAAFGVIWHTAERPLAWPVKLQLLALAAMAGVISYEFVRFMGWTDVEGIVVRHYHVVIMLLVMGIACFERHARAVQATARISTELERRVAESTRQLEQGRLQLEQSIREHMLADERQRVIADMHDGLGARLVSLLRHVQSGGATSASAEQRVRDALNDMRRAIAASTPQGGDVAEVVATLRDEVDALVAGSGVRVLWHVDALPTHADLSPSAAFFLHYIVLEAVGNVLKHADARAITFSVRTHPDRRGIELRVADDGRGYDPSAVPVGVGLPSMRSRAAQIGADLEISSSPAAGTVVRLVMPLPAASPTPETTDPGSASSRFVPMHVDARLATFIVATALVAGMLANPQQLAAAEHPPVVEFERAEFVSSNATHPPDAAAAWRAVELPDQWRSRPDTQGIGWYQLKLDLARKPSSQQAVMVRARRAHSMAFFVNGKFIGTARDNQSFADSLVGKGLGAPIRHYVLPGMLRAGENLIHVRMEASADAAMMHGLGRVYFGDAREIRGIYNVYNELGFAARRDAILTAFAAGLIALLLWFARRDDRVLFWFAVGCLSWGVMGRIYLALRWHDSPMVTNWLYFYPLYGLVVPTLVLSLRTVNKRWPYIEAILWLFFLFELTFPFWASGRAHVSLLLDGVNAALLAAGVAVVVAFSDRPIRWPLATQIAALGAMALVMGYELARYFGWVDVESAEMRHYHVPVMLVAMGAVCFDRHLRTIREAEQGRATLEARVAEKMREIQIQRDRADAVSRHQALVRERHGILAELNDGLGASLTSLLGDLQSQQVSMKRIELRVQRALTEMRIAIDALRPDRGGIGSVLGSLRYRFDDTIRAAGIRLVWEVGDLPESADWPAAAAFSLQRILIGAIDNVLEHAQASVLMVDARETPDGGVRIIVRDNGNGWRECGSPTTDARASMHRRARQLGAVLQIESNPEGTGIQVCLTIPAASLRSIESRGEGNRGSVASPGDLGPALDAGSRGHSWQPVVTASSDDRPE